MDTKYDFSGWATRANLLCSDGRIIRKDAFKDDDGTTVPLVWNHRHDTVDEVLGHALLENRNEGVYAYCTFNDTPSGQNAKLLVQHGDITGLSIYANKLKQQGCNVIHGTIKELSLVLAGANPGAYIETVMAHGDDSYEEGYICSGETFDYVEPLFHADTEKKGEPKMAEEEKKTTAEDNETIGDILNTLSEKQLKAVYALVGQIIEESSNKKTENSEKGKETEVKHADTEDETDKKAEKPEDEETIQDVFNTLTEKQKMVVYAFIGDVLEEKEKEDNEDVNDSEGGEKEMKHNVFDKETAQQADVLTHSEFVSIVDDAKRCGSLADAFLQHGINQIDYLFPDAKSVDAVPGFIKRDDTWVTDVMNTVHHTPFSRIKSVFADITEADARARGYIKGNMKVEEVFTLLKRITTPTTIYKKQKLDRDDMVDITDFDVVAWLKTEMRMMLNEEIARAILVGDGRSASSNDKINEQNIRPIWTDDDVYTVKKAVPVTEATTDDEKARAFIKACIKSRKDYKGTGNPTMYMSEDMLTNCLLLEDTNQRIIYDTIEKLATALRVKKIVPVPVMEDLTRVVGSDTHTLAGIYVNLADYNIGADKGGAVNMFDDFDIDYNQQKYLIETRCSGALTVPYSAVAIEFSQATA